MPLICDTSAIDNNTFHQRHIRKTKLNSLVPRARKQMMKPMGKNNRKHR